MLFRSREILKRKKEKILATHSTAEVVREAESAVDSQARATRPPGELRKEFNKAVRERQLADLEDLWYRAGDERSPFASQMLNLMERLGEQYQVEELAAKYAFRGNEPMTVPEALEVKQTLEAIDKLLEQLDEAEKTARLAVIDMEELARFTEPEEIGLTRDRIEVIGRLGLYRTRTGFEITNESCVTSVTVSAPPPPPEHAASAVAARVRVVAAARSRGTGSRITCSGGRGRWRAAPRRSG